MIFAQFTLEWWQELFEWLIQKVVDGFWAVIEYFISLGKWFVDMLPSVGAIIAEYEETFGFVMRLIGRFDSFFPITESLALLSIFILFVTLFLLVKLILKLIPTIG